MTDPQGPDRLRGSPPGPNRPSAPRASRSWRHARVAVAEGAPHKRRRWLARGVAAVGMLVCVALIIYLLQFLNRRTTEIAIVAVPDYRSDGMPLNAHAWGDQAAMHAVPESKGMMQNVSVVDVDEFQKIPKLPRSDVLAIYLNLIGSSDDQGLSFYLPDAAPDETEQQVRAADLWEELKKLPREQPKLLLLDVARAPIDWRLGILTSGDWEKIKNQANEISNLTVLTACAPGEPSWTSADLGQSVFGYYVCRGLSGEADASSTANGKRDHEIRLSELVEYVGANTRDWVRHNRDERGQNPMVYPESTKDHDFVILRVQERPRGSTGSSSPEPDWTDVQKLWEQRDELRRTGAAGRLSPLRWKQLHDLLLCAEQSLYCGEQKRADGLLAQARTVVAELNKESCARRRARLLRSPVPAGERLSTIDSEVDRGHPSAAAKPVNPLARTIDPQFAERSLETASTGRPGSPAAPRGSPGSH